MGPIRIALLTIQGVLASSAVVCGALFIVAPDGSLLHLPIEVLRYGPFTDFFWPGVILFLVLGVGHAVGSVHTILGSPRHARVGLLLGLVTLGWIGGQVLMVRPMSFLQVVIAGLGILELFLSSRVMDRRRSPLIEQTRS